MSEFKHFKPYEGDAPYIFISYSHADDSEVLPIVADMHQHGYNIWYDEGIEVGSEWQECIASHLADAHLVIAFISNNYIKSDNCRREMNFALSKRKKVINVFLGKTDLTPGMELQIGSIFALMKYTFSGDDVFYDKLYSAPLLQSENFVFNGATPTAPAPEDEKKKLKAPKNARKKEHKKRAEPSAEEKAAKKKKIKRYVTLGVALLLIGVIVAGLIVAYFTGFLQRFMTETKTITELAPETVAEFKEPVFEAAAREYCGKKSGDITVSDLQGMTALYVCGENFWLNEPQKGVPLVAVGVTETKVTNWQGESVAVSMGALDDLSDLQYFPSLRTLWLQFQSLNSLENMPICAIESLNINGSRVASLKGISNLPKLRSIDADGSALTSLGDLNACLQLENASFVGGSISDYSVFKPLNKIRSVAFSNSSVIDFDDVLDHSSLRSSSFYNCTLSGRFFNKFDNEDVINDLSFYSCVLDNLDGISEFTNLTELSFSDCTGISDYSPLKDMASLKTVYADAATASEINGLDVAFAVEIIN